MATDSKKPRNNTTERHPSTANDSISVNRNSDLKHRVLNEDLNKAHTVKNSMPAPPNPNRK